MDNLISLHKICVKYNLPSDICREIGEYNEIPVAKIKIIQRRWRIKAHRLYWLRTIEEGIQTCIIDTIKYINSLPEDSKDQRSINHLNRFLKGYKHVFNHKGPGKLKGQNDKRKTIIEMLLLYHRRSRCREHRRCIDKPYMWHLKRTLRHSKSMGITPTQYVRSPPSMGRAPRRSLVSVCD